MAKKKVEADLPDIDSDKLVAKVYSDLRKEFGEIIHSGSKLLDEKRMVIPISPSLDLITSGGIQEGTWVNIAGYPKTGKSTLALTFAATCQQEKYGSRRIFYADVEGRLGEKHLKGIRGLNIEYPHFNRIGSVAEKIMTAQDHLNACLTIVRTIPKCVLIIDSLSALCDAVEMDGGVGKETRGHGAKLLSQFVNQLSGVVPINKSIIIGMAHMIADTGRGGNVEKSAIRWKHQCDYLLRSGKIEIIDSCGHHIGLQTEWMCHNSALGPPGLKGTSIIRFGVGVDRLAELIKIGVDTKVIDKSGSWYSLPFIEEKHNVQGEAGMYDLLMEHPDWADQLAEKLRELSGIC